MKLRILILMALLLAVMLPGLAQNRGNGERVTICHNGVTLTLSVNGLNGHFGKDGAAKSGHEGDFIGPCPVDIDDNDDDDDDYDDDVSVIDGYQPIQIGDTVCNDIVLYHTNITGDWEIFRLGGNPNSPTNISNGPDAVDMNPSLSPDRRWMAFASNRDGDWNIFVARTNGRFVEQITFSETDDTDPVWSPMGNQIVYQSVEGGSENLILFDVLTGEETLLTNDMFSNIDPYWYPDGSKIVYQREADGVRQIFEYTFATQESRQLTFGNLANVDASYSPDGQYIAYRHHVSDTGEERVVTVMAVDGSGTYAVSAPDGIGKHIAWAPQGAMLAYDSDREGNNNVYIYDVATATTRKVTANDSNNEAPTWYCDSTQLVFASDVMGNFDLYTVDALPLTGEPIDIQSGAVQLTTSDSAETYPHSSPLDEDASRAILEALVAN